MARVTVSPRESTGEIAKGLLRHSSVTTTERHYIKNVPENTAQAMKLLESFCSEVQTSLTGPALKLN